MWRGDKRRKEDINEDDRVTKDVKDTSEKRLYESSRRKHRLWYVLGRPFFGFTKALLQLTILKVLAQDKLEYFADRVQTRIWEGREDVGADPLGAQKQRQKYNTFVQRNAGPFEAFSTKSSGTCCDCLTLTPALYVMLCVALSCRSGC